ncbi:MAG: hypothetical protein AAGH79_02240, partial [Bacteroidota bacterium]
LLIGGFVLSRALLIGFVLNLFLRAIWLAYLGIQFTFPDDIKADNLRYNQFYQDRLDAQPTTIQRIMRLEHAASLTYSFAILLTLMSCGAFLLSGLIFPILDRLNLSVLQSNYTGYYIFFLIILIIMGGIDQLVFRWFGRWTSLSRIYYPIHRLLYWVGLQFLYKREWLTLLSNQMRWRVNLLFLAYILSAFTISLAEVSQFVNLGGISFSTWDQRDFRGLPTLQVVRAPAYETLLKDSPATKVVRASIQAEEIADPFIRLFIVYWKDMDDGLDSIFNEVGYLTTSDQFSEDREIYPNDKKLAIALDQFFNVQIDQATYPTVGWSMHRHPKTKERGFIGYIPIDSLPVGPHLLELTYPYLDEGTWEQDDVHAIPFYRY